MLILRVITILIIVLLTYQSRQIRRTSRRESVWVLFVTIFREVTVDGATVGLNIAARCVENEAMDSGVAGNWNVPHSLELKNRRGDRTEIATTEQMSRQILGVERTAPTEVDLFYIIFCVALVLRKCVCTR